MRIALMASALLASFPLALSAATQAEIDLAIDMDLPVRYLPAEMISNESGGVTNMSVRPSSQETSI